MHGRHRQVDPFSYPSGAGRSHRALRARGRATLAWLRAFGARRGRAVRACGPVFLMADTPSAAGCAMTALPAFPLRLRGRRTGGGGSVRAVTPRTMVRCTGPRRPCQDRAMQRERTQGRAGGMGGRSSVEGRPPAARFAAAQPGIARISPHQPALTFFLRPAPTRQPPRPRALPPWRRARSRRRP